MIFCVLLCFKKSKKIERAGENVVGGYFRWLGEYFSGFENSLALVFQLVFVQTDTAFLHRWRCEHPVFFSFKYFFDKS